MLCSLIRSHLLFITFSPCTGVDALRALLVDHFPRASPAGAAGAGRMAVCKARQCARQGGVQRDGSMQGTFFGPFVPLKLQEFVQSTAWEQHCWLAQGRSHDVSWQHCVCKM